MAFSFEIPIPQNIESTLMSTKQKITNSGGSFRGDTNSGTFSGRGVDGTYTVGSSDVKITITQKPFIYPESAVKSTITGYFKN